MFISPRGEGWTSAGPVLFTPGASGKITVPTTHPPSQCYIVIIPTFQYIMLGNYSPQLALLPHLFLLYSSSALSCICIRVTVLQKYNKLIESYGIHLTPCHRNGIVKRCAEQICKFPIFCLSPIQASPFPVSCQPTSDESFHSNIIVHPEGTFAGLALAFR